MSNSETTYNRFKAITIATLNGLAKIGLPPVDYLSTNDPDSSHFEGEGLEEIDEGSRRLWKEKKEFTYFNTYVYSSLYEGEEGPEGENESKVVITLDIALFSPEDSIKALSHLTATMLDTTKKSRNEGLREYVRGVLKKNKLFGNARIDKTTISGNRERHPEDYIYINVDYQLTLKD